MVQGPLRGVIRPGVGGSVVGGGASETFIFGRGHVANMDGGHLGSMGWGQGPMLGEGGSG